MQPHSANARAHISQINVFIRTHRTPIIALFGISSQPPHQAHNIPYLSKAPHSHQTTLFTISSKSAIYVMDSLPDYSQQLHHHIDRYSPSSTFVCFLCPYESSDPLSTFSHLLSEHNFVFSDIKHIPLIPQYLQHWRTHAPPIISKPPFLTMDADAEEDLKIRSQLHQQRLESVISEHEVERERAEEMKCLFCGADFTGTWHEYLQWLFEVHQFNPGRPSNLVYIPELIALLRQQLESNACIYCSARFPNQRTLKSHLRKKKHMRIPNDPSFDRYYMVNYLELNGYSPDDDDDDSEEKSLESEAADIADAEVNETVCLVCDATFPNPEDTIRHMRQAHSFDIDEVRRALKHDFYSCVRFINYARYAKSRKHCFVCNEEVDSDYAKHIEGHNVKHPCDFSKIASEDQLLIPFIDGDPLLTALEEDVL